MIKGKVTVTKDLSAQVFEAIKKFKNDEVLVGIPEDRTERKSDKINNATLFAIANFGSTINNIPPWPIMAIGIKNAQEEIAEQFKIAAIKAISKGSGTLGTYYQRAGIIASVAVKEVINDQEGVPSDKPSSATLDAREARGFKGLSYWLVTGQMRNSITYVVKGDD